MFCCSCFKTPPAARFEVACQCPQWPIEDTNGTRDLNIAHTKQRLEQNRYTMAGSGGGRSQAEVVPSNPYNGAF